MTSSKYVINKLAMIAKNTLMWFSNRYDRKKQVVAILNMWRKSIRYDSKKYVIANFEMYCLKNK